MDDKKYSLNDIFALLHEAIPLLGSKQVTVVSGEESDIKTPMSLAEYVAMSVAHELTSEYSRLASDEPMAKKADVEAAMKQNYWDEVAYPNYTYAELIMSGGKRSDQKRSDTKRSDQKQKQKRSKKTRKNSRL
jgi:hypothetical protein